MEENKLTHNMLHMNSREPTSQSHASISSLEANNKVNMNITTQARNSPNSTTRDNDEENGKVNDEVEVEVEGKAKVEEMGRERLKRHREEVMGKVNIPENWGQEKLMKDWINYATFDALCAPHRLIITARDALVADVRKARSQRLRI